VTAIAVPTDARYEVKFAADARDLPRVLHWLRMHPAGFRKSYPDRRVNNVYFDTLDYAAFDEKLAGVSNREKLRYRWYGTTALPAAGVLELKCRRNMFGWKLVRNVPQPPDVTGTWRSIVASLRELLPADCHTWLNDNPMPVMINRYDRRYFESGGGRVRATVDTGLVALDQRFKPHPNVDRTAPLGRTVVLELKFGRDDRDHAAEVMHDVPIRVSAHSKYTLAVEAIAAR
jgi:hypothetical protein